MTLNNINPIFSVICGILVLISPKLLSVIVGIYLIVSGLLSLGIINF